MTDRPKSYVTKDFYNSYMSSIGGNALYAIDYKVFRAVLIDYVNDMLERLFYKSEEIRMPGRMGFLQIIKRKPKLRRRQLHVDFKSTREAGKTILHFNDHSDGYNYKFFWRKNEMIVKHKGAYELIMTRTNKRKLASIIKNREVDYLEI